MARQGIFIWYFDRYYDTTAFSDRLGYEWK